MFSIDWWGNGDWWAWFSNQGRQRHPSLELGTSKIALDINTQARDGRKKRVYWIEHLSCAISENDMPHFLLYPKLNCMTSPSFKRDWGMWSGYPLGGSENGVWWTHYNLYHSPPFWLPSTHFTLPLIHRIRKSHIVSAWSSNFRISGRCPILFIGFWYGTL